MYANKNPLTTPIGNLNQRTIKRFWSRVKKGETENDCWLWLGQISKHGYGVMWCNRKQRKASRISWTINNGKIQNDLCVLHKCDNRKCCNPSHLFLGTKSDNAKDRHLKGREARGDRSGLRLHPERAPIGERNSHAKLREQDIYKIIELRKNHKYLWTELSEMFCVCRQTIMDAFYGKTWKHINRQQEGN